jgi:hypothetical protein
LPAFAQRLDALLVPLAWPSFMNALNVLGAFSGVRNSTGDTLWA